MYTLRNFTKAISLASCFTSVTCGGQDTFTPTTNAVRLAALQAILKVAKYPDVTSLPATDLEQMIIMANKGSSSRPQPVDALKLASTVGSVCGMACPAIGEAVTNNTGAFEAGLGVISNKIDQACDYMMSEKCPVHLTPIATKFKEAVDILAQSQVLGEVNPNLILRQMTLQILADTLDLHSKPEFVLLLQLAFKSISALAADSTGEGVKTRANPAVQKATDEITGKMMQSFGAAVQVVISLMKYEGENPREMLTKLEELKVSCDNINENMTMLTNYPSQLPEELQNAFFAFAVENQEKYFHIYSQFNFLVLCQNIMMEVFKSQTDPLYVTPKETVDGYAKYLFNHTMGFYMRK